MSVRYSTNGLIYCGWVLNNVLYLPPMAYHPKLSALYRLTMHIMQMHKKQYLEIDIIFFLVVVHIQFFVSPGLVTRLILSTDDTRDWDLGLV